MNKKNMLVLGASSLIVIPGVVATIISYIMLYNILTMSSVKILDPKVEETINLLKKCALGSFICTIIGGNPKFRMLTIVPYHILTMVMAISILKLSETQILFHPDLLFLKKMSLIYIVCISISIGVTIISGGSYLYLKKSLKN
jgi:hypothetical protein